MFTGIVEGTGAVVDLRETSAGCQFVLDAGPVAEGVRVGDSVACNGCCLTVVEATPGRLGFDLLAQTREVTNLGKIAVGSRVNLERSMRMDGRFGGHFVTGHIDCVGPVQRWEPSGPDWVLEVGIPEGYDQYLVSRGCVAVDGISLTVADVVNGAMRFWIIPHTREVTNLAGRAAGDRVNLEIDMLAKYVEKILASRA